jgi:hypothetical protein
MSGSRAVTVCTRCQRDIMVVMYIRVYRSPGRKQTKKVGLFCKTCGHASIDAAATDGEGTGQPCPLSAV